MRGDSWLPAPPGFGREGGGQPYTPQQLGGFLVAPSSGNCVYRHQEVLAGVGVRARWRDTGCSLGSGPHRVPHLPAEDVPAEGHWVGGERTGSPRPRQNSRAVRKPVWAWSRLSNTASSCSGVRGRSLCRPWPDKDAGFSSQGQLWAGAAPWDWRLTCRSCRVMKPLASLSHSRNSSWA